MNFNRSGSSDVVDVENFSASTLALTTTAAQTAALHDGLYAVWSTADCFIRVGPTATGVTASNGYPLRANTTVNVYVREGSKIGGIVASSTATLSYHQVG